MKRLILLPFVFLFVLAAANISCVPKGDKTAGSEISASTHTSVHSVKIKKVADPTEKLVEIIAKKKIPKSSLSIYIDKSEYYLAVKHADSVLIKYPCVFGFNAVDDKAMEGDGCTPEGNFGIRSMYAHKSWKYFIWIDYPNAESWRRFKKRKSDGDIPSDATIGGEVGIHGVPEGMDDMIDKQSNWTLGCISLKNAHITDLYKSIDKNVKVEIVP